MKSLSLSNTRTFFVEYKYSACIKIQTHDISILCDPWFSNNAYYGAWARYPNHELTKEFIGEFDFIWISHIHPDHYCPWTIERLFDLFGPKKILLADWGSSRNYLLSKLISDGFEEYVQPIDQLEAGSTVLKCIPNRTGSPSDIDSSLIVYDLVTGKGVLNLNDCITSEHLVFTLNSFIEKHQISIELLCLGYTGAGPYPQAYYSPNSDLETLERLADAKKSQFFDRYLSTISQIPSQFRLPFAGKYLLAGELSFMNPYRGVADALEVKKIDPKAIILDDSGCSKFELYTHHVGNQRDVYYDEHNTRIVQPLLWKQWLSFTPDSNHLKRLLQKAYCLALTKSECTEDFIWNIYTFDSDADLENVAEDPFLLSEFLAAFNCKPSSEARLLTQPTRAELSASLYIDRKALLCSLTGICHWNNLEVGTGFFVRREPDVFVREAHKFLNFLSVI